MLKINSKRRKRKNDGLEDPVELAFREQLSQEVERQTKSLKNQLAQKEHEARNNQSAAEILSGFINKGDLALDERGQVVLTPNRIKNHDEDEDSMLD